MIDLVVIGFLRLRRSVAVPVIFLFVANQVVFVVVDGWHEIWVSVVGWFGALAFIAIRYGLLIRLAFATRPLRRR